MVLMARISCGPLLHAHLRAPDRRRVAVPGAYLESRRGGICYAARMSAPVYANFVEIVVRISSSEWDAEAAEVLVERVDLGDGQVDAEQITQELRSWLLDG